MLETPHILLLDRTFEIENARSLKSSDLRCVICLFWTEPSTVKTIGAYTGVPCYSIKDIVGSGLELEQMTYDLTLEIVNGGPLYGNMPWRTYLTEQLYRKLDKLQLLLMTAAFIERLRKSWSEDQVKIESLMDHETFLLFIKTLSSFPGLSVFSQPSSANIEKKQAGKKLPQKLMGRYREASLTAGWKTQFQESAEWLDKTYKWRQKIGRMLPLPHLPQHGITFFSSYVNNSRSLAQYEELMPAPVNWVIANFSAFKGISDVQRYDWLWRFYSRSSALTISSENDTGDIKGEDTYDFMLRDWFKGSSIWANWRDTEYRLVQNMTLCWDAYLENAKPRLIVMANQWGIDGWFTLIARRRGIPVLQVMHGVLGGYLYTRTPVLSDALIVFGDFWRNLWPESERKKIISFNPQSFKATIPKRGLTGKSCLTFFSWPLNLATFYNESELFDGLIHIFMKIIKLGYSVTVRAHPLENLADFVARWQRLYGSVPKELNLSKEEPLNDVLEKTDVALMFRSTVMLNCIGQGIPVVMPGWIDYGWNQALTKLSCLHMAADFKDLEDRLLLWLKRPPMISERDKEIFISPAGEGKEELLSLISRLMVQGAGKMKTEA